MVSFGVVTGPQGWCEESSIPVPLLSTLAATLAGLVVTDPKVKDHHAECL